MSVAPAPSVARRCRQYSGYAKPTAGMCWLSSVERPARRVTLGPERGTDCMTCCDAAISCNVPDALERTTLSGKATATSL
jgi:hypothetical protein